MASPKELVGVVSDAMGVPSETVSVIDRTLAAAGLRTRALRGRGNTPMTYRDAAHLIIATALESAPKDAADIVQRYTGLPAKRVRENALIATDAIGTTFGEALANLVESIPMQRERFSLPPDHPEHMAAEVTIRGPRPYAEIAILKDGNPTTFQFGDWHGGTGDLRRAVQFTQITLGSVGELVAAGFDK